LQDYCYTPCFFEDGRLWIISSNPKFLTGYTPHLNRQKRILNDF